MSIDPLNLTLTAQGCGAGLLLILAAIGACVVAPKLVRAIALCAGAICGVVMAVRDGLRRRRAAISERDRQHEP